MAGQSGHVSNAIASIAASAEEQSAATEEVSASAEEMMAQVDEMTAQAQQLAATAQELRQLAARFTMRPRSGGRGTAPRRLTVRCSAILEAWQPS
jgi:methyl-accepting chemotaxis protein